MWNLIFKKRKQTNELIYNRNRHTDIENKLMFTKGEMWVGGGKLEVWDEHTHTIIYKVDNQQGPTV